jgi:hypothetical protein
MVRETATRNVRYFSLRVLSGALYAKAERDRDRHARLVAGVLSEIGEMGDQRRREFERELLSISSLQS